MVPSLSDSDKPQLFADERGVWREDMPGHRSGIEWAEVYRITGHKLDGITEEFTCVELAFEYGHSIELYADWPGFEGVVTEISKRLPGISPAWFEDVASLQVGDAAIECWRREHPPRVSG